MQAVRIHQPGDAGAMQLENVPLPQPASGEARVKLTHAGLNFIDIYQRSGVYKLPLPLTLGREGVGTVDALGEGNTQGLTVGRRVVFAMQGGSYAEYASVPAWTLVPLPDGVSDQQAAAVMLQGMTAQYLARSTYVLKDGDTCLIHAAAGGVGGLLVQIAKLAGGRVIGTAGSQEKAEIAREAGADEVILYREQDFEDGVKRLTNGEGLEVVYDSVGRDTFSKGLNVLKPRGLMVLFGASSGPVEPLDPQILNQKGSLYLTRPSLAHYTLTREELLWRTGELFGWLESGQLKVRVDRVFPLAEVADAHRYMEAGRTKGKVLLSIA